MSRVIGLAAVCALALTPIACAQDAAVLPTPEAAAADTANWRAVDPENLFIFDTTKGRILIEVAPVVAPKHAEQFRKNIRTGKYDGTSFHRVIDGFMAQGGDIMALHGEEAYGDIGGEFTFRRDVSATPMTLIGPPEGSNEGYYMGFPMMTQSEFLAELSKDGKVDSWIPHCPGVVSTARTSDPNSANSQFFLMRNTSDFLDREYTAWGRVVAGQEAVMSMKVGEPVRNPDILKTARVAADLPAATRPQVWSRRTDSAAFKAELDAKGIVGVCDLPPVAAVVKG